MKKSYSIAVIFLVFISSCIVSKKKYQTLGNQKNKSIDSLQTIISDVNKDYENQRYIFSEDKNRKRYMLDSFDLEVRRLANDTSSLKSSLRDAINEFNVEKLKLVKMETNFNKKSKIIDSLTLTLNDKQKRLTELEAMIEKNKKDVEKLKDVINKALNAFDNTELSVYLKNGKVYVSLEEKLLFKVGSAKIDKKGEDAIIKLAEVLEKNPDIEILIEGHTDNSGSADLNWKLSTERALSIVDIITTKSKVEPKRITASGCGMYRSIADNTTKEGKQKNRRIEIVLVPKLESLYNLMNK